MKTLILLFALAIIGTIGLECYEKSVDSTDVNKKKVSSTTVEKFLKIMGDQDPQDLAKLENAKGKGEVECKSCLRVQGNGNEMQVCAIDKDDCNNLANFLKLSPGTSSDCCETDGCNEIGGSSSNSNANGNGNNGLECYEKSVDSTGVNKKKVSSTTVEKFLKIATSNNVKPQALATWENAKGKGEVGCQSCLRAQGNGNEMQVCTIDIGLECYEKGVDSTGVNKKKVSSTTVEKFLKIKGDQDPQDLAKLKNANGKGEEECKSCLRAQDNKSCCETDQCNEIGGTSSNTNRCNKIELKMIRCFHGNSKTLVSEGMCNGGDQLYAGIVIIFVCAFITLVLWCRGDNAGHQGHQGQQGQQLPQQQNVPLQATQHHVP